MVGTATIQAVQSTIDATVAPQSLSVGAHTLYVFTIVLKDKLSSTGWMEVYFPSAIVLPSSITSVSASGTGIRSAPTVTANTLENKLVVTNLASSTLISAQTFTLTVGLITNPGTSKPTGTFTIASYYQTGT